MSNILPILLIGAALVGLMILILVTEAFLAYRGEREDFKNPDRVTIALGDGEDKLKYVVLGDSTSAGQGGDYQMGIALSTVKHLSQKYKVEFTNFSISGATTEDVLSNQLNEALNLKPDLILLSVGGNDVTHLTSVSALKTNLEKITTQIIGANCQAKIVLTAIPDMGAIPRFAQPLRSIVGLRVQQLNKIFFEVIDKNNLTLAPIAKETGPLFRKDKSLFAKDNFHPNNRGYQIWIPVLNKALDQALLNQPDHCLN